MRLSELERESSVRPAPVMAAAARGGNGSAKGQEDDGDTIRRQVEQLVDSNPDRVAQQLRSWMQEE